jgi:hypothetical protein
VTSAKSHQKLFDKITYQISYYVLCFCPIWAKTQHVITYLISYLTYVDSTYCLQYWLKIALFPTFFSFCLALSLWPHFLFYMFSLHGLRWRICCLDKEQHVSCIRGRGTRWTILFRDIDIRSMIASQIVMFTIVV